MATLDALEDFVRDRIETDHWTHRKLSDYLQNAYPGEKRLCVRSVQRFCRETNIFTRQQELTYVRQWQMLLKRWACIISEIRAIILL